MNSGGADGLRSVAMVMGEAVRKLQKKKPEPTSDPKLF